MADNNFSVSSFIIRFIQSENASEPQNFRGSIRHIQAEEEINFTDWEEVKDFVNRFVPINPKKQI